MKDLFSGHAADYSRFRPGYPEALVSYLASLPEKREYAWDCGTGNGQLAGVLAQHFGAVYATDISAEQMRNAIQALNIRYRTCPAESTSFTDAQFDLVTVAQAVHWFDFDAFYNEVKRVLKPGGFLAVTGYALLEVDEKVDEVIRELYSGLLKGYWDPERKYIDELYRTIPFPFEEIEPPVFRNEYQWDLSALLNYLETWSAVKHYTRDMDVSPVTLIFDRLKTAWGKAEKKTVTFPVLLRVGRSIR
ncbi:class I SAM-dependent methyltransferase [Sinomicrobium soli]|uniref:class I SAM-dependent methyltransferase n=1 Tax=Sinomicrobium sp. N-1-3-6 TaxID=2219864 RepID=UPI000DCE1991|nr:class I SAM-dependent methyltransferase [Sinomicrobium sp. N-1-3-6]RAV30457.1 SAM-dependent methyltransferase [Sinomicrobium sp. N-1-3-6]